MQLYLFLIGVFSTKYRDEVPDWLLSLDKESVEFIRKFILNSGSLKNMAEIYDVSYPTVRIKLDMLIKKSN